MKKRINNDFPLISIPNLQQLLWDLLAQVPPGVVTTFGSLARAWGDVRAARSIAEMVRSHRHTDDCPCFRVVTQDGSFADWQLPYLQADRIPLLDNGRVDLGRAGDASFISEQPLLELKERQLELARRVEITPLSTPPEYIAGVDVSYCGDIGVGGYAEVTAAEGKLISSHTRSEPTKFPYIPGFLAFRELPTLLPLLQEVRASRALADVLLVDGNGMLHPEHVGIASHLGVLLNHPTVGVGKSLLCGQVDLNGLKHGERRPVLHHGELIAFAVRGARSGRPLFVSVGHRITLPEATDIVQDLIRGHRLPEPLFYADHLSRVAARLLITET